MDALTEEKRNQIIEQVGTVLTSTGIALTDALAAVFELAQQDEVKLALTDPNLAFIDRLEYILREETDGLAVAWAVSVVTRLSASVHHNKEYLAGEYRGLCPEMVRLITQPNVKNNIYVFFGNCVLNAATIPYLLSERLGLVEAAKLELESNPDYKFVYTFFANAVTTMNNSYCAYFIRLGVHELIVNRLIMAGPDPKVWPDRNTGAVYRSMGFVTSFSTLPDGCHALRQLHRKEFFQSFLEATAEEKERMQASIILANLYGQEENDPQNTSIISQSLLTRYPNVLPLLVNLLASIIDYTAQTPECRQYRNMGLAFGVTKMRDATASLLKLAMNEQNKLPMITHGSFLAYVLRAVRLFVENAPPCFAVYQGFQSYAGGGGKDLESIQNLIEMLLQLSFLEGAEEPLKGDTVLDTTITITTTTEEEKKKDTTSEVIETVTHTTTSITAAEEKKEEPITSITEETEQTEQKETEETDNPTSTTTINDINHDNNTIITAEEVQVMPTFKEELIELLRALIELPEDRNVPFATTQCAIELLTRLESLPHLVLVTASPKITVLTDNTPDEVVDADNEDNEENEEHEEVEEEEHHDEVVEEEEVEEEEEDDDHNNNNNVANTATTTTTDNNSLPNPQHIMIHCAATITPDQRKLLTEFGKELRRFGYDTWIDREGSGLIPGLIGRDLVDQEVLLDAVNHAYAIILCISPDYKTNPLCRLVADYASQRRTSHDLKIYYVMLDEHYHTSSIPHFIDGWLGLLLGIELWYPLWNSNHPASTTDSIAAAIGNHGKVFSDGRANSFIPPPRASHVLFSYAPNTIHKELIEELRIRMKMYNYDVWSYEAGSLLVPSIFSNYSLNEEDYDEQYLLKEALQCSQTMVMFISKEYRDHPDCRQQANAAFQLVETGQLQILYVMLDEHYHTSSKPEMLDGWIGYLVGLDQWYPLWNMDQMENTMLLLVEEIGGNSKASQNQRYRGYIEKSVKNKLLTNPLAAVVGPPSMAVPTAANAHSGGNVITGTIMSPHPMITNAISSPHPMASRTGPTNHHNNINNNLNNHQMITPMTASSEPGGFHAASLAKVMRMLTEPRRSTDYGQLQVLLDNLGLEIEDELTFLEPEQTEEIVALLKPAPARMLLAALQGERITKAEE